MRKAIMLPVRVMLCLLALNYIIPAGVYGQGIGINNPSPAASAILDLTSTNKGLLIPRMSAGQRISIFAPAKSLLVFDTTANQFYFYTGSGWSPFLTAGAAWLPTGNAGLNASSNFLGTTDSVDLVFRTNNNEKLRVTAAGALLATGNPVNGVTPTSGAGARMMWIPSRGAFRAGRVFSSNWDDINIGKYSFAGGIETTASGYASLAMGDSTTASGFASFAVGNRTTASGFYSTAFGDQTTAQGNYSFAAGIGSFAQGESSFAFGNSANASADYALAIGGSSSSGTASVSIGSGNTADLDYSVAIGNSNAATGVGAISLGTNNLSTVDYAITIGDACIAGLDNAIAFGKNAEANGIFAVSIGNFTRANSYNSFALGRYNDSYGSSLAWNPSDELLVVGNGISDSQRSNALVLLKNGKMGVGNIVPQTQLEVDGGLTLKEDATLVATTATLSITVGNRSYLQVNSNGTPATRSVLLSDGLSVGQLLIIECTATAGNGIRLPDNTFNNLNLNAQRDLLQNDNVTLIWNGTDWIEVNFSDN